MGKLLALSVSIGVLGAIWAWLALDPLSGIVLVWAGFIAWGCFFHTGGDSAALVKTICGNIYGIVVAWIALIIIVNVPVEGVGAVWPAIVVGVTVFFLVIVASIDQLSAVPANVYGYASMVAWSLSAPSIGAAEGTVASGPLQSLFAASFANPLVVLVVSMVLGALFGWASAKLAGAMTKTQLSAA